MKKNYQALCVLILICVFSALPAFGQTAEQSANLKKAASLVEAIERGDREAGTYYDAACYFALGGKTDEAFSYLGQAIDLGFANVAHIRQDTDLTTLRADPRWLPALVKAEAKQKEIESLYYNRDDFYNGASWKTPYRANLSEDEKIAGLSKFWSEVKYNFVNFDLIPGVDWDALYIEYLPKVRATGSTADYFKVLFELSAKLRDGHTNIYAPAEIADQLIARPLVSTGLYEDKVLITSVIDDSIRQKGLEVGQELIAIDGIPVMEYAEKRVKPYISASTPQALKAGEFGSNLLAGSTQTPVELTIRNASGKTFKQLLQRISINERNKKSTGRPSFEYKLLPGNIAYVALNSFGSDQPAQLFAEKYEEIAQASAIIFDVRQNGGGNSQVGWSILGFLTDKPFATTTWYTRNYRPTYRAWSRPQSTFGGEGMWQPNGKKLYTKPVVVLTSPNTGSAAEDFTGVFKIMKRGTIIGEPTNGSTGQPLVFSLPGGALARVCTKRDKFPDGSEFVGKGIIPDKFVAPTVADFRTNRDTVLEAALAELKK